MKGNSFSKLMFRSSLVVLICWMVMNTAACSTEWVSQATNIINLLMPIVSSILALVGALGANIGAEQITSITTWGNELISDLQNTILPLLTKYNQVSATDKPGVVNKLHDALTAIQDNTASLLSALHIDNATVQAKVIALIQLVQSMVVSLVNFVPVIQSIAYGENPQEAFKQAWHEGHIPHSASQFKKLFNQEMTRKTGDTTVDSETPKFVIS